MNKPIYFFDTYALIELIFGNAKYLPYKQVKGITTTFNLAELNYNLKKIKEKKEVDEMTKDFAKLLVSIKIEDIVNAMDLKLKHKYLSIPDAIGYIVAQRYKVKFLTGDEDFKDFPNVEFVKK